MIELEVTEQPGGSSGLSRSRRLLDRLLRCVATASAGIFLAAVVVNLVSICFVRHPFMGFSDNIVEDAKAIATGHLQYGNPATQFVGFSYTPLFTWLFAGLLKIYWWEGWGPVLSMSAAVLAMASLVRMLWTTTTRSENRLVTASFVVALSLGGLSALPILGLPISGLYEARSDQMAWCLLVVAGTVVFRALLSPTGLSRRQMVTTGLLLTGSVYTKQTTLVPSLLLTAIALVVPRVLAPRGTWTGRHWFRSATVFVTFVASSALFGLVLQLASRGWAYDLLVNDPLRYARWAVLGQEISTSLRLLFLPLIALTALVVCVAWSLRSNRDPDTRRRLIVAMAAVVLALSPIPTAILAETKLGGEANQLAGPVWTLTLGCAVLLLLLRPSVRQLAAAAIACGVLLAGIDPLAQVMPDHLGAPNLHQTVAWSSLSPFLVAATDKGEPVYDGNYPSLSVSPGAPRFPAGDINDIMAAGYTPRWFIDNILTGKYALVAPLVQWFPGYDSNEGRYDGSVMWKLDLLLHMGYTPVKHPPSGTAYYRPTPRLKQLGWFGECFGPYQAPRAGLEIRLRGSGGLACIDHGALHLSQAPSPTTDYVMTLAAGKGEAQLRFAKAPHDLRIVPLDAGDHATSPASDMQRAHSAVSRCLAQAAATPTLTIRAGPGQGRAHCRLGPAGPVLDIPLATGEPAAHVAIEVAATDSPRLVALSPNGQSVPFTLLNLTPRDVNSL